MAQRKRTRLKRQNRKVNTENNILKKLWAYKRFGCFKEDYEVGHLLFLLIPIHLLSSFVGWSDWKRNDLRKRDNDTFKLNFYSQVYNYLVGWMFFSQTNKIAVLAVELYIGICEGVSCWRHEAHIFMHAKIVLPVGGLLGNCFFFVFIYIILCLFLFCFTFYVICSFFIYYSIPT